MRLRAVLGALLSHWRRHPVELATLLTGLALATALWSGVQALNAQAHSSYARAAALLDNAELATIRARGGGSVALADYVALRRAGWPVSPVLEGTWRVDDARFRVIGIDPLTLPAEAGALSIGSDGETVGDFLRPPYLVFAHPDTAPLPRSDDLGARAVLTTLPPGTLLMDIGAAERLLGRPGAITRLIAPARDTRAALPAVMAGRLETGGPGAAVDLSRLTASFHLNLTAFGFLSFIVGLFIVYSAVGLTFEQRKPMLRTLRACGTSARGLALCLLVELLGLALLGGSIGILLGYLLAGALLPDVALSLRGLYGADVGTGLTISPFWWLAGLLMSLAGAGAAAAASLWRAVRLPILAPARPQAWRADQARDERRQIALAGLLAFAALLALGTGDSLLSGFVVLAGLLLGAALLLPGLLNLCLRAGHRAAGGALVRWAWADSRLQLSGLSLALMALLMALSANVGVSTMVGSFRATFLAYLDQRFAQDIYVSAPDEALADEIALWLGARADVGAVLRATRAETEFRGWPLEVRGQTDHVSYRENWPLLSAEADVWDRVARGEAGIVSEQTARRFDLALGDTISVPGANGALGVRIAGIYPDYGNPAGQIYIAPENVAALWPEAERVELSATARPEAVATVLDEMARAFPRIEGRATDQAGLRRAARAVFEKTFAVTLALNALTLAVAGIALLTSLLTLAGQRIARAAPVCAIGVTRRQIARIDLARTVGLALLTALLALPLGLAVAWVLTAVVNVQAFGWRLPVMLFPGDWTRLFALALITALAAAAYPVWRMARVSPAELLRGFADGH